MNILSQHLLSWVIFLPVIGAGVLVLVRQDRFVRQVALGVTLLNFFISLPLWFRFDLFTHQMQFTERISWIPTFNIHYAINFFRSDCARAMQAP